jgi:hypothetical protein
VSPGRPRWLDEAPALKGDRFYSSFEQEPIDRLYLKARDTMPPNFGVNVDAQGKLDIITFILKMNGYPSGPNELKIASEDLATALILRKGEQAKVQNFSLVQTVGCLTQGAGNTWVLTRTAEPLSTREDTPTAQGLEAPPSARWERERSGCSTRPRSSRPRTSGRRWMCAVLVFVDGADSRADRHLAADGCSLVRR